MKQMTSGMLALVGVFALASCYSYASEAINNANYNTVQATPQFAVVKVGDSDQMIVRLVNDANNGAVTSYAVSNIGSGIAVHYQDGYRPVFDAKKDTLVKTGDKTAQQYFIVGVVPGVYNFTVTPTSVNTGVSATVRVVVTPKDLGPALSKTTGAAGDTIVITAPINTVFSQTSVVSFATGVVGVASRAADSSSITVVVSGGVSGLATVTRVGNKLVPSVAPVTLVSTNSLVTTAQAVPSLSVTSAAAGATVTLTAGTNTFFAPNSAISFATGATSVTSRAADSSSISFLVGPGITGPAAVTNVGLRSAKTLPLTSATTSNSLATTALTVAPTTVANAAPLVGVSTTVALSGGLRFLGNSHVFIGGTEAGIQSVSADSSTATVMPMLGSTGLITYTNIALSFLNSVALAVPGDKSITVGATYGGATDANATALATATTIVLPPLNRSFIYSDAGPMSAASQCAGSTGDGCRVYKFVLTGATSYDIDFRWQGGSDMGLYRFNAAGATNTAQGSCDNGGQGPSGQPETCTVTALPAGTYFFSAVFFGTGSGYPPDANTVPPTFYQFRVTVHP